MDGLRKLPCVMEEAFVGEVFRTDAKCEPGRVVLGGWLTLGGKKPTEAPWFSVAIGPAEAPWLFKGEDLQSSWASTSAELLSSLLALKVFKIDQLCGARRSTHVLRCGAGTDNKATSQLVQRRLSTKWPLMILLMDYLSFCEASGIHCKLDWRPRDSNIEADQLTNEIFSAFDLNKRVEVDWNAIELPMVSLLMKFSESFSKRKVQVQHTKDDVIGAKFQKSVWG